MQSNIGDIVLPSPSHIGAIVKDISATTKFLSSICGIGPWETFEDSVSKDKLIVGRPFKLKAAVAKLGSIELELLQPLEEKNIWSDFLTTRGEGIHHICFVIPNWDKVVPKLQESGARMVAGAVSRNMRWCYLEIKPGGIIVEFEELL